jgi:hypothetical protein
MRNGATKMLSGGTKEENTANDADDVLDDYKRVDQLSSTRHVRRLWLCNSNGQLLLENPVMHDILKVVLYVKVPDTLSMVDRCCLCEFVFPKFVHFFSMTKLHFWVSSSMFISI